ncbi:glycoside hydrolase family 88 protein [Membranicola marinus]|uniref:Glycoside hydrolase family 88 protein n=1 Tax=Membranihabitans marinus TaxID=1227546 RepID=A0A953HTJ9_9BACT|nr:glycosyl hydrolase [Membranihabitans marinus]MBY5957966.1 glycoside hydrolase family 88 protein [Membranihabitans marinus]
MKINQDLTLHDLVPKIRRLWELSGEKIDHIHQHYDHSQGSPVFTVQGKYSTRGWTEWTQGFEFGAAILQHDITGEKRYLEIGRQATLEKMADHVGHFGVHDHGFNNVSTYGNLLRLMKEGKIAQNDWEQNFYELALKLSGSVQAKRWTNIPDGGYLYSFNGPHSLFVDTIRTIRSLVVSHELEFYMMGENDQKTNLLHRAVLHALSTAKYSVFYGEGRDTYDEWGRTAHESVFNVNDGNFRCPATQQGYSGFTTWTRGLAWAMVGFPEQLEYLKTLDPSELESLPVEEDIIEVYEKAARATCDFFIDNTPTDGIPYWDAGAPGLAHMGDYLSRASDPYNDHEPVDSSAAAIGAQGLLRLGKYLNDKNDGDGTKYWQAGLTVLNHLFDEPYLSTDPEHQGLILHSIYHRPNGWDYVPKGSKIPYGESSMWGDYHAREVALLAYRILNDEPYYTFFSAVKP